MGHTKTILKSDQEPAIVDVQIGVRNELRRNAKEDQFELILGNSPVGESESNGSAENAVK